MLVESKGHRTAVQLVADRVQEEQVVEEDLLEQVGRVVIGKGIRKGEVSRVKLNA